MIAGYLLGLLILAAIAAIGMYVADWLYSVKHSSEASKMRAVEAAAAEAEDAIHDLTGATFKAMTDAAARRRSP